METIKILHINSYYNGSSFYKNLYDIQEKENLDMKVYVPVPKDTDIDSMSMESYIKVSENHGKYDRYLFSVKHRKIYRDILIKYEVNKYNLIHAHSLFSNGYIAYKLNKNYGIPYVVAVRNTDVNVFFKKMVHLRKLGKRILEKASKVIFISKSYRDYVISNYIDEEDRDKFFQKTVVIPNGIDRFWLNNKYKKRIIPKNKKIELLYVGALNKNKNIDTTIKSCKILIERGFKLRYTIIGKIKHKKYEKIIEKYPFIEYLPYMSKEELIKYYRRADVFVMPSFNETFGIVYLEALSQSLPIIYTAKQGFDGWFNQGDVGFSVKADDELEIANRIEDIIDNYEDISQMCLKQVDKFNWNDISDRYLSLYKEILESKTND